MPRIHILGASGAGTTTLGAALASGLGVPHLDSDDAFWVKTDPPYVTPRAPKERVALLLPRLSGQGGWVLSGAAIGWGEAFAPLYDLIVFLRLENGERMRRLHLREAARHGARILPGGDMHVGSQDFLTWAAGYESGTGTSRSLAQQERWLARQTAPVLRLDSAAPVAQLVGEVRAFLGR
jgi:hypothetical protein